MQFEALPLLGLFKILLEPRSDSRGFFARRFSAEGFAARGLETHFPERSFAHNAKRGTIRGLHFQEHPFAESKIIRCTKGAAFDVMVDIRIDSPTFGKWHVEEITEGDHVLLYVPKGFAHGYQSLTDETELDYEISEAFNPQAVAGIRWNDPALAIPWPLEIAILSARDLLLPDLATVFKLPSSRG
jgi:dTDP-4-dehydrorhamnose 3,5-epimerase